ncbi:MAG: sensor histidine kinase [Candidatus Solibacter sp.]
MLAGGLHGTASTSGFYTGDLIVFTTGLLITALLLVLTLRAAKLPGTPLVNIGFAVCAFLWSAGGLARSVCSAVGVSSHAQAALVCRAIQYSAAAAFPVAVLALWRPYAATPRQKAAAGMLRNLACACALALSAYFWWTALHDAPRGTFHFMQVATASSAALLLLAGAAVSLPRATTPRPVYLPSLAIVVAVWGAAITLPMADIAAPASHLSAMMLFIGMHLVMLVVLCAFFLFARFRFADLFVRYGVRILLAGLWASMLAFFAQSGFLAHVSGQMTAPGAMHVFAVILLGGVLLLSFTVVDDRLGRAVNRWLFRPPDYRGATRQLGNRLAALHEEQEIAAAAETAAVEGLHLRGARVAALSDLPPALGTAPLADGELVELDYADPLHAHLALPGVEVLIPVHAGGAVTHVLMVAPGSARPGLVSHDLNFLRAVAAQVGNRLDALHREREAIERQSREAHLLRQVAEAELRALRAQINPHFLFNSLNTIADLIVRDAAGAEAMTLRLATVFRHVLAHSSRSMTTLREEVEFLRTYLYIEEARFGDRLRVTIDVAPPAASQPLPSLILQPLVENAMKHGLGPKPGPGNIWITAAIEGDHVVVKIEDDGMGPPDAPVAPDGCHGLQNVAGRLQTVYGELASVHLAARPGGGACVTVRIPRLENAG